MKRFHFRLQKLLDLRAFEEYLEKVKLGKINEEIEKIKEQMSDLHRFLDVMFLAQEEESKRGMLARQLSIYDYSFRSYRNHLKELGEKLKKKEKDYQSQLQNYVEKRNKVKILDKLKEKNQKVYHHEAIYKEENEIEQLVNGRVNTQSRNS